MKTACLLDTETTGLDPIADRAIEVAVTLFDLGHAVPVSSFSSLILAESNAAEAINRIPAAALLSAPTADAVWRRVQWYVQQSDVILAHRAEFDRQFVPPAIREWKWCCTKFHVAWPKGEPGASLVSLALAHGIGVVSAHRAPTDVDILTRLLTRVAEMGTPLVPMLEHAMRPRAKVIAQVSYDDRERAKAAGFAWDPVERVWWKDAFTDETFPFPMRAA